MQVRLKNSFTVNDMARGCSQLLNYGHILTFGRSQGWIGRCCETTSGNALNTSCQARRVIRVARLGTIGGSSKPSSGSCAPAVPGVTCLPSLGTGTVRMCVFHVGVRRVSGSAWPLQCVMMPIWSTCSSTPPLFVPTSILSAPKKAGGQEIGRSRGGLTTKLHVVVDALGNPLRVILSAGQIADIDQAAALIKDQPAGFIVADKGYDSDAFVAEITAQGSQAVIPPRSNRLCPRAFDRHLYQDRNLIERFFSRLKQFRRIATRYDKLAKSFLSFIHLACAFVWLA